MNFFEHQNKARRQTRWLVFLFVLAVVTIVVVIDLVVLMVFGVQDASTPQSLFSLASLQTNLPTLVGGAVLPPPVLPLPACLKPLPCGPGAARLRAIWEVCWWKLTPVIRYVGGFIMWLKKSPWHPVSLFRKSMYWNRSPALTLLPPALRLPMLRLQ